MSKVKNKVFPGFRGMLQVYVLTYLSNKGEDGGTVKEVTAGLARYTERADNKNIASILHILEKKGMVEAHGAGRPMRYVITSVANSSIDEIIKTIVGIAEDNEPVNTSKPKEAEDDSEDTEDSDEDNETPEDDEDDDNEVEDSEEELEDEDYDDEDED